jgi:hypothetical protein
LSGAELPAPSAAGTPAPARLTFRDLFAVLTAVVLAALVYRNALHNPFVYDDNRLIVTNPSIEHLSNVHEIVWHEVTRPIVNLSYAIDFHFWGRNPFGYHLTSLGLHLINIALVYLLAWRVTDDRQRRSPPTRDWLKPGVVAFGTAMLFAVHPMMTEAVGYVSGRSELLCGIFFLVAMLTMRRRMQGGGAGWLIASIVAWLLAMASKEIAVMFPLVLLAYDWLVCPGTDRERRHRITHVHLPFYVVGVIAVIVRLVVFAGVEQRDGVRVVWPYILAEIDVMRRYLLLLLMAEPGGQTIFHAVPLVGRVFTVGGLLAIGTLAFLIWIIVALKRARRAASFGLLWFLLLIVPSSALVVFNHGEPMAEHRVYLASVGFFLALGIAFAWLNVRFGPNRAIPHLLFRITATVGVLSLGAHAMVRNAIWSSPVSIWAEAVDKAPDSWYPAKLLGESLHDSGMHDQAVDMFKQSITLRPSETDTYSREGICLVELGRLDEAQAVFEKLRTMDPSAPEATNGLGTVALSRRNYDLARQRYLETLVNNPLNVPARVGLAEVEERTGHPAEALARCEEIHGLAPGTPGNDDCIRRNRDRAAASGSSGR